MTIPHIQQTLNVIGHLHYQYGNQRPRHTRVSTMAKVWYQQGEYLVNINPYEHAAVNIVLQLSGYTDTAVMHRESLDDITLVDIIAPSYRFRIV